jgi:hypothetical protein
MRFKICWKSCLRVAKSENFLVEDPQPRSQGFSLFVTGKAGKGPGIRAVTWLSTPRYSGCNKL